MKTQTVVILAVVVGGGILLYMMSRSTSLPRMTSSSAPTSTLASIFQFGTKALDVTEKALPKFFDNTPDVSDASLDAYPSSSGFAAH